MEGEPNPAGARTAGPGLSSPTIGAISEGRAACGIGPWRFDKDAQTGSRDTDIIVLLRLHRGARIGASRRVPHDIAPDSQGRSGEGASDHQCDPDCHNLPFAHSRDPCLSGRLSLFSVLTPWPPTG